MGNTCSTRSTLFTSPGPSTSHYSQHLILWEDETDSDRKTFLQRHERNSFIGRDHLSMSKQRDGQVKLESVAQLSLSDADHVSINVPPSYEEVQNLPPPYDGAPTESQPLPSTVEQPDAPSHLPQVLLPSRCACNYYADATELAPWTVKYCQIHPGKAMWWFWKAAGEPATRGDLKFSGMNPDNLMETGLGW